MIAHVFAAIIAAAKIRLKNHFAARRFKPVVMKNGIEFFNKED
jgi:hypothetical protein